MPDATLALVLDAATLRQFRVSHPTWRLRHPELWDWPWLVLYDAGSLWERDVAEAIGAAGKREGASLIAWGRSYAGYETQRERMLTAFVYGPAEHVATEWWLKLDTDAVATRRDPAWPPDLSGPEVYWASRWGYTKAKGGGGTAAEWAERLERWGDAFAPGRPRLGLAEAVQGSKIRRARMASWISLYRADWTRALRDACRAWCGDARLPVPSQDTCAWYFAARRGDARAERPHWGKRLGWTNCPRQEQLARMVESILTGATT